MPLIYLQDIRLNAIVEGPAGAPAILFCHALGTDIFNQEIHCRLIFLHGFFLPVFGATGQLNNMRFVTHQSRKFQQRIGLYYREHCD